MGQKPSIKEITAFMQSNESVRQVNSIFEDMSEEALSQLEVAHNRYEHLIDITSGDIAEDVVKRDRLNYPQYMKTTPGGSILFDDDDCTAFMSALTGIPTLLCHLYIANDFFWTAASGFVEDQDKAISDYWEYLKPKIKDDKALSEIMSFLIDKGLSAKST